MCGKVTQDSVWTDLSALMRGLDGSDSGAEGSRVDLVTPMRVARVIALDRNGERRLVPMRWGLAAPWEQGRLVIHARCETIDQLPTFKDAFARRRGILVCRTFNEGQEIGAKTKQFVITPKDGKPVAIAVIHQPATLPNGQPVLTFAMATTPNNKLIGAITDRMPAVLQPGDWPKWLGEEPATPDELKAMLKPYDGDWDMAPQEPAKPAREPAPRRAAGSGPAQRSLF